MKFRTEIEIPRFAPKAQIGYSNRIVAIGSCFAEQMTAQMRRLKFACTTNPTGVVFNPASAAAALRSFAAAKPVQREELCKTDGIWHHFDFHGAFSAETCDEALARMNAARQAGVEALRTADRLIVTFGTAWVFEHSGLIVANCHRHPATDFTRRRLSVAEIVAEYSELFAGPLAGREVILTVSPVRHLGDGLEGNAVSKATLRLAAAELAASHSNVHYFPAYEILTDDLRDYRFYADDLVHPAPQAVEYVWEKFVDAALSERAQELLNAVGRIVSAAAHRPRNCSGEAHREFCRRQIAQIEALSPIDFSVEAAYFRRCLEINL